MSRIIICGGPRTGKTTLARHLALGGTYVWAEIEDWLLESGVAIEYSAEAAR